MKEQRNTVQMKRETEGIKVFPLLIVACFNSLSGKVLLVADIITITRVLVGVV
jgi:hypothetical protein